MRLDLLRITLARPPGAIFISRHRSSATRGGDAEANAERTRDRARSGFRDRDPSIFQICELLTGDDLKADEVRQIFPGQHRHVESDSCGLLSFFYGDDAHHVVLKAKELSVERPHGHIIRSGQGFIARRGVDVLHLYAAGGFASQLTLGNTSLGKLLSAVRDPLNLIRSNGLRIFIREHESAAWKLLGVPSAFEMARDQCRWHYRRGDDMLTVSCIGSDQDPVLTFDIHVDGPPVELLICGEIAAGEAEYESRPRLTIDPVRESRHDSPRSRMPARRKSAEIVFHVVGFVRFGG